MTFNIIDRPWEGAQAWNLRLQTFGLFPSSSCGTVVARKLRGFAPTVERAMPLHPDFILSIKMKCGRKLESAQLPPPFHVLGDAQEESRPKACSRRFRAGEPPSTTRRPSPTATPA